MFRFFVIVFDISGLSIFFLKAPIREPDTILGMIRKTIRYERRVLLLGNII